MYVPLYPLLELGNVQMKMKSITNKGTSMSDPKKKEIVHEMTVKLTTEYINSIPKPVIKSSLIKRADIPRTRFDMFARLVR